MEKTRSEVAAVKRRTSSFQNPCLVVIYGVELGRKYALDRDEYLIGRTEDADIQFDQDSVSRNHARIIRRGAEHVLADLGSTNGTYVNDRPVDERPLRDGDIVQVGQTILKYLSSDNLESAYHEEIYRLTVTDGLTQCFNKRYLLETLERELSRAKRYRRDLCVILIDIDHFKRINDTHGHLAGDAVLRQVATEIRGKIRRDDVFARYGGEEFAIVVPEADASHCLVFAEKIRKLVERTSLTIDGERVPVTISLGVAQRADEDDPAAIIKRADDKLYEAKAGGRNCVRY